MIWDYFIYFAIVAIMLWAVGAFLAWKEKKAGVYASTLTGMAVFFTFIVIMWVTLERPPLRTMGETRLWYSFFLPLAGILVYSRWKYKWILSFSTMLAAVFICINIFKPEIHSKALMPALQSPERKEMDITDNLVNVGLAFLTFGMLFGALWAKEAWGHYWSWDPKETWAAITWLAYLGYIHYRIYRPKSIKPALWVLLIAFILLQVCWWGINYLPSAQGSSVHTYTS